MALALLDLMPDAADHDIRILATDIDPNMVAYGAAGVYEDAAVEAIPQRLREFWMTPARRGPRRLEDDRDNRWTVGEEMRRLVAFKELNLIGDWPMKGTFQAIFCRNVVIYFDEPTQGRVWSRFLPFLAPGGTLYIGHSERLSGPATAAFEADGVTTYRKRSAA